MIHRIALLVVLLPLLAAALLLAGCKRQHHEVGLKLPDQAPGQMIGVIDDTSGSFRKHQTKVYAFLLRLLDAYGKNSSPGDRLVISQLSGGGRSILWEGHPRLLRRDFPSAAAFEQFIVTAPGSDPDYSRVYQSFCEMTDYILACPGIESGKSKGAVFLLSDCIENAADSDQWKARLERSLAKFGEKKGIIGIYWCDPDVRADMRRLLNGAGIKNIVETDVLTRPELPMWK